MRKKTTVSFGVQYMELLKVAYIIHLRFYCKYAYGTVRVKKY